MGLDARYDSDQRKSLSAIAFKQRQSQSTDYADAYNNNTTREDEDNTTEITQSGRRTEQAVMHWEEV